MISFRVFGGIFTVRPFATLFTLIMFVVLIGLGSWQVERLHWKQNLIAEIHTRMAEAPRDVSAIAEAADLDYAPARASGIFLNDKELYLHAISLTGEGGYHVLTPLQLTDGRFVLVDRGFVPFGKKLPATRNDGQITGPVSIAGIARVPTHRWLQPADDPEHNEWFGVDLAAMAKVAGVPQFLPFVLEADAASNPGGYPVGGQTRLELPNNHLSYVITWYGLAVALLIIYGVSGWRPIRASARRSGPNTSSRG